MIAPIRTTVTPSSTQVTPSLTQVAPSFESFLPTLKIQFRKAAMSLPTWADRTDAVAEMVGMAFRSYASLVRRGRTDIYPTPLGDLAIKSYFSGRRVAGMSATDATSDRCQLLGRSSVSNDVCDYVCKKTNDPAVLGAFRVDFKEWKHLNDRVQAIQMCAEKQLEILRRQEKLAALQQILNDMEETLPTSPFCSISVFVAFDQNHEKWEKKTRNFHAPPDLQDKCNSLVQQKKRLYGKRVFYFLSTMTVTLFH